MTFDKMAWQRQHRQLNNNIETKRYEKTIGGFLVRCYRNMLSRVSGVTKKKNHLYLGKDILPKKDFYSWAIENNDFNKLFYGWQELGYIRTLTTSINRIDPEKGYILGNIEWITFSENCKKTRRNQNAKK